MSDPPKKLGSLRDRIAAFENKGSAAPPPPAPRPKPAGGASWKPRARSPPLSPPTSDTGHGSDKAAAGMSAADAKVSIGQGGSLKERMAALQGLNAFGGGPSLPPKPATEKPKWKPPPVVAAPVDDENDDEEKPKAATSDAHAHAEAEEEQRQGSEETERPAQEEAQGEPDPEEEERQRRAAIAARLARLGGARVGMAPPMFGKKPEVKKPEAPKDEVEKPSDVPQSPTAVSPPSAPSVSVISEQGEDARAGYFEGKDPALLSPSPEAATAVKSPSSMPVPAAPRRAAPPRKRAAKSPSPSPATVLEEGVVNQSPSPIPNTTPDQAITTAEPAHGDREPEVRESQVEPLFEKMHITEGEATTQAQEPAAEGERALGHVATAEHAHDMDLESGNHQATSPGSGEHITVQSEDVTPHSSSDDMPTPEDTVVVPAEYVHTSAVPSSEPEQLEEEDEEARRKRIAERLAKAGGINPLSGLPLPAPTSPSTSPPLPSVDRRQSLRKDSHGSVDRARSPEATLASALRRGSTDAVGSQLDSSDHAVDPPRPLPPIPTSSRPDVLGRKGSVASVQSNRELPSRRASQDDHGFIASNLHEEPMSISEPVEVVPEEEGVTPHEFHDAFPDEQESTEEQCQDDADELEPQYEEHPTHLGRAEVPEDADHDTDEYDTQAEHQYYESREQLDTAHDIATLPPPIPAARPPPPIPSSPRQSDAEVSPSRSASLRHPVPPPPRAPPRIPEDEREEQADYEEELQEAIPPPPPVRRNMRPPASPIDPQPVLEHPGKSLHTERPVTYLEVEEPEQYETFEHDEDGYESSVLEGDIHEPEYIQTDDEPLEHMLAQAQDDVRQHEEEMAYAEEEEEVPPPPPPRRVSVPVPVHVTEQHPQDEYIAEHPSPPRSPSPPPPPPQRPHRPISQVPARSASLRSTGAGSVTSPTVIHSIRTQELLDDSDGGESGDPIDPTFYSPRSPMRPAGPLSESQPVNLPPPASSPPPPATVERSFAPEEPAADAEEDTEHARRRTIAERMAKLGGIRFGAPPPPPVRRPQPPPEAEVSAGEDVSTSERRSSEQEAQPEEEEEEEDEFARKQRIAARIAGMGGMRFGMMPGAVPQQPPPRKDSRDALEGPDRTKSPQPQRSVPLSPPPTEAFEEDGEQVEHEESEAEEISYADAQDEAPPPVPSRQGRRVSSMDPNRPPVPPGLRPPVPQVPVPSKPAKPTEPGVTTSAAFDYPPQPPPTRPAPIPQETHAEYVMVEEEEAEEPPPPPPRTVSLKKAHPPPRTAPPPPPPPVPPAETSDAQWEIPSAAVIPSVDFGGETDLSLSGQWSEDSTNYPPPPPAKHGSMGQPSQPRAEPPAPPRAEVHLTADDLVAQWGRVGVQIHEVATVLFDKSKKTLVGDGSYLGFVTSVLGQVPTATQPVAPYDSFGYLIYAQNGSSVQRRVSDVMPGDVIVIHDAKFKGHKGLQSYHQTVGTDGPLYAIIGDYEVKKAKVKVFQANQHVGQQTVESASYRLEDLKSGSVKIFRVLEA